MNDFKNGLITIKYIKAGQLVIKGTIMNLKTFFLEIPFLYSLPKDKGKISIMDRMIHILTKLFDSNVYTRQDVIERYGDYADLHSTNLNDYHIDSDIKMLTEDSVHVTTCPVLNPEINNIPNAINVPYKWFQDVVRGKIDIFDTNSSVNETAIKKVPSEIEIMSTYEGISTLSQLVSARLDYVADRNTDFILNELRVNDSELFTDRSLTIILEIIEQENGKKG